MGLIVTPILYPMTGGNRQSFVSLEVQFGSDIIPVEEIAYARKRERSEARVNHPDPVGKTRGENKYSANFEMLLAEWNYLQSILARRALILGLTGYGDVQFSVFATYIENGFDIICDEIRGCTLDSSDGGAKSGTAAITRKSELSPLKILYNGLDDTTPLQTISQAFMLAVAA